jgi:hypothetical protein
MRNQDDEGIRTDGTESIRVEGTGPDSAGQSGDTQGLSDVAEAGSESVEELVEEGQFFEAEVISGVEDAPEPDVAEVYTKEVPEDDVPSEYRGDSRLDVPVRTLRPPRQILHLPGSVQNHRPL